MSGRLIQMSGIVVDLVYAVDRLPDSGAEVEAHSARVAAGGGFNAMIAAQRSGAEVAYGGALGTGLFAEMARAALAADAIPNLSRGRKAIDQGACVVLVEPGGERSFVSHHGAERELEPADFDSIDANDEDWLLLSGYGLYHPRSTAASTAWLSSLARGPTLFFDPGPMVAETPEPALVAALRRADWLSVNWSEARALTGEADPARAAEALARGRIGALVRAGREGCWLATPGVSASHLPGFPVEAVDTTGAGDAHDGAFIASSLLGLAPRDAAVYANAAAAISTTARGPATAPTLADTQAFLARHGVDAAQKLRPSSKASEALSKTQS